MEVNFEKLENFTNGVGAARVLQKRAHKEGFLIEGLVLYAAIIDGFCRIALVLKQQIEDQTQGFDLKYIYQKEDTSNYSERDIYKLALEKLVLDQNLFDEINALYDFRNKAIHRFLISEIEYAHLEIVLDKYELIYQRMWNIVYGLESEQIYKGVGMTISGKFTEEDKKTAFKDIFKKINTDDPEKLIQSLGSKLITDTEIFSVDIERGRIADEISDEIEIREEKTKIPPGFSSVKEITKWAQRNGLLNKCICGHEKSSHIDIKEQRSSDRSLEEYVKRCQIDGCKCQTYSKSSKEVFP